MQHLQKVAQPNTGYISTHLGGIMSGINIPSTAKDYGNNSGKTSVRNKRGIVQEL